MIFDTHMHTIFSSDSKMSISEVINTSKSLNLGVCLTILKKMNLNVIFQDI